MATFIGSHPEREGFEVCSRLHTFLDAARPPDGQVSMTASTPDVGWAELAVAEHGPGIAPDARRPLVGRFCRPDPARSSGRRAAKLD